MPTDPSGTPHPDPTLTVPSMRQRLTWFGRRLLPVGLFLATGVLLIVLLGLAQRIGWISAAGEAVNTVASAVGTIFTCREGAIRTFLAGFSTGKRPVVPFS